jgi:hypothetical protein
MDVNRALNLIGGIGLGAGLAYFLDPQLGKSRRAHLRDKARGWMHETQDGLRTLTCDLQNRARGLWAEVRSTLSSEKVPDRVLVDRVRSKLGRVVSHPGAIDVEAHEGKVTLSGPVLAREVNRLVRCVERVRGVCEVENRLNVRQEPGREPNLQGGRERTGQRFELLQNNWSPTARFLVGLTGGALTAYGTTCRFPTACILGTIGLGLIGRSLVNLNPQARGRRLSQTSSQSASSFSPRRPTIPPERELTGPGMA